MLDKLILVTDSRLYEQLQSQQEYRSAVQDCIDTFAEQACYMADYEKAVTFLLKKIKERLIEEAFKEPDLQGRTGVIIEDREGGKDFWKRSLSDKFVVLSPDDFNPFYEGNIGILQVLKRVKPLNIYIVIPDSVDVFMSRDIEILFNTIRDYCTKYSVVLEKYICYEWVFVLSAICYNHYLEAHLNGFANYTKLHDFVNSSLTLDTYLATLKAILPTDVHLKTTTLEIVCSAVMKKMTAGTPYAVTKSELGNFYTQSMLREIIEEISTHNDWGDILC